jgi:hypothetical protein
MDLSALSRRSRQVIGAFVPDCAHREPVFTVMKGGIDPAMLIPFIEYIRGVHEDFIQHWQQGDTVACARLMHSVKGVGGAVGFPEVSVLGAVAEELAKQDNRQALVDVGRVFAEWLNLMDTVSVEQA